MNLTSILSMLKALIPVLEPIGEQGIAQLFDLLDAQVAKSTSPDMKDTLPIISKALREIALLEFRKLR